MAEVFHPGPEVRVGEMEMLYTGLQRPEMLA
jgi:hypothetical protein